MKLSALLELVLKQLRCKKIMKKKPKFKAICYRDLKQDGYDNTYELINQLGELKIKEQIIKGQSGYPNMVRIQVSKREKWLQEKRKIGNVTVR